MVSCGSDTAPIQRALLSGLFINAAILLPDSKSIMLSSPPELSSLQDLLPAWNTWNLASGNSC